MTTPVRLCDRFAPWFEGALRTHLFGEPVVWEISFGVAPLDEGKPGPVLIFYLEAKGVLIGNRIADITFIPLMKSAGVTEEIVDRAVAEATQRVLEQRREQSSMGNGSGQLIDPTKLRGRPA